MDYQTELNLLSNWYAYQEFAGVVRSMRPRPVEIHETNIRIDTVTISQQAMNVYQSSVSFSAPAQPVAPVSTSQPVVQSVVPVSTQVMNAYKKQHVSHRHHINHKL